MQKCRLKILLSFSLTFCCTLLFAQSPQMLLREADSLFVKKQYTQSLEKYQQVFESGMYSPAMLLRLSLIEEGLGHTARSLYYLNLNYLATNDDRVLAKMEEVASKNQLDGYEISSTDRMMRWLTRYQFPIRIGLSALSVFFFSLLIYSKRRKHDRPYAAFSFFFLTILLLVALTNYSPPRKNGIITQAPIYLMSGPSSGSEVITILGSGHRVVVEGKKDVWLKVRWAEKEAYVKETQLLPIEL